eukprot:gene1668-1949_t
MYAWIQAWSQTYYEETSQRTGHNDTSKSQDSFSAVPNPAKSVSQKSNTDKYEKMTFFAYMVRKNFRDFKQICAEKLGGKKTLSTEMRITAMNNISCSEQHKRASLEASYTLLTNRHMVYFMRLDLIRIAEKRDEESRMRQAVDKFRGNEQQRRACLERSHIALSEQYMRDFLILLHMTLTVEVMKKSAVEQAAIESETASVSWEEIEERKDIIRTNKIAEKLATVCKRTDKLGIRAGEQAGEYTLQ